MKKGKSLTYLAQTLKKKVYSNYYAFSPVIRLSLFIPFLKSYERNKRVIP